MPTGCGLVATCPHFEDIGFVAAQFYCSAHLRAKDDMKIASGLMGVLLLMLVGVMGAGRTTPEQPIFIQSYWNGQYLTELVYPQAQNHLRLGQFPKGRIVNWSDDGRWVYFFKNDLSDSPIGGQVMLVRSRLNGDDEQVITRSFTENAIIWTPNQQWILSLYDTPQGLFWRRVRPDGSDSLLLTQNLDESLRAVEYPVVYFSPDGLSMYFDTSLEHIYRANLKDGVLENITNDTGDWMWLSEIQLDGNTLLVKQEDGLTQIGLDGRTIKSFGAKTAMRWLPQKELLILSDSNGRYDISGVSLKTGQVLWEIRESISDWAATPDQEWLIFFLDDIRSRRFQAMRWDGTDVAYIDPRYFISNTIGAGPDSECFFYTSEPKQYQIELIRIFVTDWQSETVWTQNNTKPILVARTNNDNLIEFLLLTTEGSEWVFYQLGCRGEDFTQLYRMDGENIHELYLGPRISLFWQPAILAALALTLITTPILLSHLRRRPHPAT